MDETGVRFLSTTFPRTAMGAAFEATVEASQKHHDAALGKNGCYHLFRLPLHIEQRMHEEELARTSLPTKEEAMDTLASYAESQIQAPDGPVQIGVEKRILKEASIQELAAHYHSAFSRGIRSYPYFSADT